MALQLNTVAIAGNLTRDPVVRFLANEQAVANFGLAINRRFKGADGTPKDDVTFLDIEAWGKTAEFVGKFLTKGTPVFISGRLKLDTWDDKDGKKQQKIKVVADDVKFTESKGDNEPRTGTPGNQRPSAQARDEGKSTSADPLAGKNGAPPANDEPPF